MAHKTFISYKYSEAQTLRQCIINALNEDTQKSSTTNYSYNVYNVYNGQLKNPTKRKI